MPLIALAATVGSTVVSTATSQLMSTIFMQGGQDEKQNPISKLSRFMGVSAGVQQNVQSQVQAMDVDNTTMGQGIGGLISKPLTACVEAQSALNNAYITDILRLCEVADDGADGAIVARVARMNINTPEGFTSIEIPLLSLVQPAQLAITSCHIDFTAEVTNNLNMKDTSTGSSETKSNQKSGLFQTMLFGKSDSNSTLSATSSADRTINSTKKNVYSVSVKADQVENAGMAFLQELLKTSMKDSVQRRKQTKELESEIVVPLIE
jgi:hypothetical protein